MFQLKLCGCVPRLKLDGILSLYLKPESTHLWLSNPVVGPIIKSYRASDLSQVVVGWGWGSIGFQVRVRTAVVVGMEATRINLLTIVQQLKGRSTFMELMELLICTSCNN